MIEKIISGGQTGVDRAALDTAIKLGIPHGGWCPKNRMAEDGTIPNKYLLKETDSSDHAQRTRLNIEDSDGTLILVPSLPVKVTDGTVLTITEVQKKQKPFLIIDLSQAINFKNISTWIEKNKIKALNIAGPRESQKDGIYVQSCEVLEKILRREQSV